MSDDPLMSCILLSQYDRLSVEQGTVRWVPVPEVSLTAIFIGRPYCTSLLCGKPTWKWKMHIYTWFYLLKIVISNFQVCLPESHYLHGRSPGEASMVHEPWRCRSTLGCTLCRPGTPGRKRLSHLAESWSPGAPQILRWRVNSEMMGACLKRNATKWTNWKNELTEWTELNWMNGMSELAEWNEWIEWNELNECNELNWMNWMNGFTEWNEKNWMNWMNWNERNELSESTDWMNKRMNEMNEWMN